jgi:anti-anti-sigma factor
MAIKITVKEYKRVDLVEVGGRVDSSTAPQLEKALGRIFASRRYNLVIDAQELDFISLAGVWVLISYCLRARCFYCRGDIRLAGLSRKITRAMELAGLDLLFKTYSDSIEAVASF